MKALHAPSASDAHRNGASSAQQERASLTEDLLASLDGGEAHIAGRRTGALPDEQRQGAAPVIPHLSRPQGQAVAARSAPASSSLPSRCNASSSFPESEEEGAGARKARREDPKLYLGRLRAELPAEAYEQVAFSSSCCSTTCEVAFSC